MSTKPSRNAALPARRSAFGRVLPASFYARDTALVARELLGTVLVCSSEAGTTAGIIVETEAYVGEHDAACHAAAGLTNRTAPLYGAPGSAYVYLIYGMHWCLNAVTRPVGLPGAVLVRAIEPVEGISLMLERRAATQPSYALTNGPGKLCQAMGIDREQNSTSLVSGSVRIHRGQSYADSGVTVTPRIGIRKAADWMLRYLVSGSGWVSKTPAGFPSVQLNRMSRPIGGYQWTVSDNR